MSTPTSSSPSTEAEKDSLSTTSTSSFSLDTYVEKYAKDMIAVYNQQKVSCERQRKLFLDFNKERIISFLSTTVERNSNVNLSVIIRNDVVICISSNEYKQFKKTFNFLKQHFIEGACVINKSGEKFTFRKDMNYIYLGFSPDFRIGDAYIVLNVEKLIEQNLKKMEITLFQTELHNHGTILHLRNANQMFLEIFADPILNLVNEYVKCTCINTIDPQFSGNIIITEKGIICISDKLFTEYNFKGGKMIDDIFAGNITQISSHKCPPSTSTNMLFYVDYFIKHIKSGGMPTYDRDVFGDNIRYAVELIERYFLKSELEFRKISYSDYTKIHFIKCL
jgi:hypothetical protein